MKKYIARIRKLRTPQRHTDTKGKINGKTQKGNLVCRECGHIFIKKEWINPRTSDTTKITGPLHETICMACKMLLMSQYGGEITIEGVPAKFEEELKNLVNAYGKRAMQIDSQHRVLKFEKQNHSYRVTTSENQLAVRLAKKIKEVFRCVINLYISHSKEPFGVNRVRLVFA